MNQPKTIEFINVFMIVSFRLCDRRYIFSTNYFVIKNLEKHYRFSETENRT